MKIPFVRSHRAPGLLDGVAIFLDAHHFFKLADEFFGEETGAAIGIDEQGLTSSHGGRDEFE